MKRWAAFLRGVMPTNARMPELKAAFETAGFANVVTVLGSGNVVFDAKVAREARLEERAETAMQQRLGRSFPTIVRSVDDLRALLEADPFRAWRVPAGAKRVVTFLRHAPARVPALPVEQDGACIYGLVGREAFTAYVASASARGPVFMQLIERTLGKDVTTRTWDTLDKVVRR